MNDRLCMDRLLDPDALQMSLRPQLRLESGLVTSAVWSYFPATPIDLQRRTVPSLKSCGEITPRGISMYASRPFTQDDDDDE